MTLVSRLVYPRKSAASASSAFHNHRKKKFRFNFCIKNRQEFGINNVSEPYFASLLGDNRVYQFFVLSIVCNTTPNLLSIFPFFQDYLLPCFNFFICSNIRLFSIFVIILLLPSAINSKLGFELFVIIQ